MTIIDSSFQKNKKIFAFVNINKSRTLMVVIN